MNAPIVIAPDRSTLRDVPWYEGLYAITCDGKVWSHEKTRAVGLGRIVTYHARWMRLHLNKDGYVLVTLSNMGKRRTYRVHQLVAVAWIGAAPSPACEVNHDNGVKADNSHGNLEWVTRRENVQHAWRTGLCSVTEAKRAAGRQSIKKAHAAIRKITQTQAEEIRRLVAGGMKKACAGRLFGLTYWSVRDIVAGKTYLLESA